MKAYYFQFLLLLLFYETRINKYVKQLLVTNQNKLFNPN